MSNHVSNKSRLVATLLCFFLGVIGVHRFYTGHIFTGLVWLFTGGFFGIGATIDLILILCGVAKDGSGYRISEWMPK